MLFVKENKENKENKEKSRLLTLEAVYAAKTGYLEKAENLCRNALAIDKFNFIAAFNISTLLTQRGMHEEAIGHAAHCSQLRPMEENSWEQLINIYNHAFENSTSELAQKMRKNLCKYQREGFIHERHKMYSIKPGDILIRVLEEEYADLLLEQGELFFRTTRYFRELEDSDPRQDKLENNPSIHYVMPTDMKVLPGGWIKQETNIPGISTTSSPDTKGSPFLGATMEIGGMEDICCFSIISRENVALFLEKYDDEKLGSHAIVIKNAPEFIERIETAFGGIDKASVKTGYVTYIYEGAIKRFFQPPGSSMPLNPFIKRDKYSPEFEYRLVTKSLKTSTAEEGAKIHIGSIEDIADKIDTKHLKQWLKDYY